MSPPPTSLSVHFLHFALFTSFCLMPPPSASRLLLLPHSISFFLLLLRFPHFTSFYSYFLLPHFAFSYAFSFASSSFLLPHFTSSLCFIFPLFTSFYIILPYSTSSSYLTVPPLASSSLLLPPPASFSLILHYFTTCYLILPPHSSFFFSFSYHILWVFFPLAAPVLAEGGFNTKAFT